MSSSRGAAVSLHTVVKPRAAGTAPHSDGPRRSGWIDGARGARCGSQREVPTLTVITPLLLILFTEIVVPVFGTSTPIHSGS